MHPGSLLRAGRVCQMKAKRTFLRALSLFIHRDFNKTICPWPGAGVIFIIYGSLRQEESRGFTRFRTMNGIPAVYTVFFQNSSLAGAQASGTHLCPGAQGAG